MSERIRRIETLRVLIAASTVARSPSYTSILGEMNEVLNLQKMTEKRRRFLLEVLHSTRALDSCLKEFTAHYGLIARIPSIGGYLKALRNTGLSATRQLSPLETERFLREIADKRNRYMHTAGAYPANDAEIRKLISEMHVCLSRILAM